jgi:hypothetical protein
MQSLVGCIVVTARFGRWGSRRNGLLTSGAIAEPLPDCLIASRCTRDGSGASFESSFGFCGTVDILRFRLLPALLSRWRLFVIYQ